jgi:hypothetical protein
MDFHTTVMGHRFFEAHVPAAIEEVRKLNKVLRELVQVLKEGKTAPPAEDPRSVHAVVGVLSAHDGARGGDGEKAQDAPAEDPSESEVGEFMAAVLHDIEAEVRQRAPSVLRDIDAEIDDAEKVGR